MTYEPYSVKRNGLWRTVGDFAILGATLMIIPILVICLPLVWAIGWVTGK